MKTFKLTFNWLFCGTWYGCTEIVIAKSLADARTKIRNMLKYYHGNVYF